MRIFLMVVMLTALCLGAALAAELPLQPGDQISLAVLGEADLTSKYTVGRDGYLSLPLAGRVLVAGLDSVAASGRIAQALSKYVRSPQVSLELVERARYKVVVMGQVKSPGAYEVTAGSRVEEAVAMAGGALPEGDPAAVTITRQGGEVITANISQLVPGPLLMPGDKVMVPQRTTGTSFRVLGAVAKPGLYPVTPGIGAMDALGAAGGALPSADLARAKLVRGRQETVVDLSQPGLATAALQEGDSLIIPSLPTEVYVMGAVTTPGRYMVKQGATVLEVLAQVGGMTPLADSSKASLIRLTRPKPTHIPLDLKKLTQGGDFTQNRELESGDMIFVPAKGQPRQPFNWVNLIWPLRLLMGGL